MRSVKRSVRWCAHKDRGEGDIEREIEEEREGGWRESGGGGGGGGGGGQREREMRDER